jgi:mono/diheme cytochrome c family protein
MKTRSYLVLILIVMLVGGVFWSCERSPQSTGIEYAPQMYHSFALEPYSQMGYNSHFAKDKKNAQDPPAGTIARGKMDYYLPMNFDKSDSSRNMAGKVLNNPLAFTTANVEEGKRIYSIYCQHCHGKTGKGDGSVTKKPSYPAKPPAYDAGPTKALNDGQIFHTITYGKNLMGPHGSQIAPEDRWKIVHYVKTLRGEKPIDAPAAAAEKPKADSTVTKK